MTTWHPAKGSAYKGLAEELCTFNLDYRKCAWGLIGGT